MMANGWQEVLLGEILTERKEIPTPESLENGEVGIVSKIGFNEGKIEIRVDGKTKTGMILAHPGDLVISGINAAKGAIAIYPETARKPIAATIHYGAYIPNKDRADIKYLWWFLRSATFRDIVQDHIPGGIKTELKSKRFLAVPIPLPSLKEQQRILARIESLAARVNEAKRLREEVEKESELLLRSIFADNPDGELIPTPMRELVSLREPDVTVTPDEFYHFAGTYSFGRGMFRGIKKKGNQFAYKKLTRLRTNDFTYPKLMAWEGAYAVIPPECDGLVVSTEFPVFELNQEKILPETMAVYFRNPAIWETLSGQSTGTNVRRRRLNPQTFLNYRFPLPPMKRQLLLQDVQAKVNALREYQSASGEELSAMMPSALDKAFKGEL
jgi:type I restriction enzyme, S subunit